MLKLTNDVQAVSNSKPLLAPFEIYDVVFDGVSSREITGVKDPSMKYYTMDVKFSNANGTYTHTLFMPKEGDEVRQSSSGGFEMASNFEVFKVFIKQVATVLINEEKYNTFFDKIRTAGLDLSNPTHFQKFVEAYGKLLEPSKNKQTQLKLMGKLNKNTGMYVASLPLFAKINRDGELYPTNFIGSNLFFTAAEKTKIDEYLNATPTKMGKSNDLLGANNDLVVDNTDLTSASFNDVEIDLDL